MNKFDPFNIIQTKKNTVGKPPGTLNYTGMYKDVKITIDVITYDRENIDFYKIKHIEELEINNKICWINITGLHDIGLIKKIGEKFKIHNMDLEDIVHMSQLSKIEIKKDYLFSTFRMVYIREGIIKHEQVSVIIKDNLLITFQETPGDVFDDVRERLYKGLGRIRNMEIDYLYYSLIDSLVDQYLLIINSISLVFAKIETKIVRENSSDVEEVHKLRKEIVYLLNAITPIKETLKRFMKEDSLYFNDSILPYYSDVMDHLNQTSDSLKGYSEMINSLYEMQMANASSDINKTMMTLTIFSVIFIPLSFLSGVFGMNFRYIPGLDAINAFYFFVGICFVIAIGMLVFFKRKKWY